MMKHFQLNWPVFVISFVVGILYIYLLSPAPKIVVKFPSPFNAGKVVYRDKSDECYVFDAVKVECTKDALKQPLQM